MTDEAKSDDRCDVRPEMTPFERAFCEALRYFVSPSTPEQRRWAVDHVVRAYKAEMKRKAEERDARSPSLTKS